MTKSIIEANAVQGGVFIHDVLLAEGERWVEDGVHVIRSTEFGLIASGATLDEAARALCETLEDYADYVSAEPESEVTVEELERSNLIYRRLSKGASAHAALIERAMAGRRRAIEMAFGRRRRVTRGIGFRSVQQTQKKPSTV